MIQPCIVFMGSPDFAVPSLEVLAVRYPLLGVVTQPDRPAGRGRTLRLSAVKQVALRLGLPIAQPERLRDPEALTRLRSWSPDLIVVAAFGQILPQEVLDLPLFGCVNVHASLLPRWRGAAPIQAAILAGDAQAGVTIMKMDAGVDTGPILSQGAIPILPEDTAGNLFEKLSRLGADLLLETIPGYLSGKILPKPQPAAGATYAPLLTKEDGLLDSAQPAAALERHVRAFHPWPGAWIIWQDAHLKILRAHAAAVRVEAGRRLVHQGLPGISTADGLLVLDEVQPSGKKPMPGKDFLSGARDWAS